MKKWRGTGERDSSRVCIMPGSRWSDVYAMRWIDGPSSPMSHWTYQGKSAGVQAWRIAKLKAFGWISRVDRMEHRVWTLSWTAV
jgi:hypothetical protein